MGFLNWIGLSEAPKSEEDIESRRDSRKERNRKADMEYAKDILLKKAKPLEALEYVRVAISRASTSIDEFPCDKDWAEKVIRAMLYLEADYEKAHGAISGVTARRV